MSRPLLEIWSPLPPEPSGVADYVEEQLPLLAERFRLRLITAATDAVRDDLRQTYEVAAIDDADASALRLYHLGNSPAHSWILREALETPGVVALHEWNLHELFLGQAVRSRDFGPYRDQARREHGARGAVAADTMSQALGGPHWPAIFPMNAAVLESALAVVALAGSTAEKARRALPHGLVGHVPHHALLRASTSERREARQRFGVPEGAHVILAPGLATVSKSLDSVHAAVLRVAERIPGTILMTSGGGGDPATSPAPFERALGRVPIESLGDAIVAADVVCALRFPSRGEASGVVMRALAAGRAIVVSSGSTADEDFPEGALARVSPGPLEAEELEAVLSHLLLDQASCRRLERLALVEAGRRTLAAMTDQLASFLLRCLSERSRRLEDLSRRRHAGDGVRPLFRRDVEAAARGLGLTTVPSRVFERLAGL